MRILLTEDDVELADNTAKYLKNRDFAVDVAYSGEEALEMIEADYDVIVLDLNLPDTNGIKLMKDIKSKNRNTPILALTARDTEEDKLEGLRKGFDDYVTKPFSLKELIVRLGVLYRSKKKKTGKPLRFKDFLIDSQKQTISCGLSEIKLSLSEFRLFHYMVERCGRKISKKELLETI